MQIAYSTIAIKLMRMGLTLSASLLCLAGLSSACAYRSTYQKRSPDGRVQEPVQSVRLTYLPPLNARTPEASMYECAKFQPIGDPELLACFALQQPRQICSGKNSQAINEI
jgi:hypothetical protein